MTHRERYEHCEITYFGRSESGGLYALQSNEPWDVIRIEGVGVFGDLSYLEYSKEEWQTKGQKLLAMLNRAFEAGQKSKIDEIKGVLKISR